MTTLHPTAALGAPASAGAFLLEEDTALYPVGRRLATASLETRQFDFLDEAPAGVQALTAMALAPDRRCVAICERWAGATAGAKATAKVRIFHLPRPSSTRRRRWEGQPPRGGAARGASRRTA